MKSSTVGLLTIGQSPRDDLFPEIKRLLKPHISVINVGALDGLTADKIAQLTPSPGEIPLITSLKDGTSIKVGNEKILPAIHQKIKLLQKSGVDLIALLCTSPFYDFISETLILKPGNFIDAFVKELSPAEGIGVLVPLKEQVETIKQRWEQSGIKAHIECASPYGNLDNVIEAAARLSSINDLSLIIMDCLGYSLKMKELISPYFKAPIILPRSFLAGIINELLQKH